MPQQAACTGVTVAPLMRFRGCATRVTSYPLVEGVALVWVPRIEIDESVERILGTGPVGKLRRVHWALQHTYAADLEEAMGSRELASRELLNLILLALWITRPTGASIRDFIHYRDTPDGTRLAGMQHIDRPLVPGARYVAAELAADDLVVIPGIARAVLALSKQDGAGPVVKRALYYLDGSLMAALWHTRFVMLTTVLESLFTTGTQEIGHKMAERVAWFLADDPQKRRSIFDGMKRIYQVRSQITHGAELDRKVQGEYSKELMHELEMRVQAVLRKVLQDETLLAAFCSKEREDYLTGLLFR